MASLLRVLVSRVSCEWCATPARNIKLTRSQRVQIRYNYSILRTIPGKPPIFYDYGADSLDKRFCQLVAAYHDCRYSHTPKCRPTADHYDTGAVPLRGVPQWCGAAQGLFYRRPTFYS